jgi:hypothetical protein
MSKFLNLMSRYNSLLNEEDQINPKDAVIPPSDGTEDPNTTPTPAQEAQPKQVSPDIVSAVTIQPSQIQSFIQSLYTFFDSDNFKGDNKQEILNAMSGKDDMQKLPNILTSLATIFNPETKQPDKETIENIKAKDDYQ